MFLKIDGINGESIDKDHANEIEIQSWGWCTHNQVKWEVNQGGHSTKVHIKEITVTKICDQASVTLFQYCMTGKHFKNARIICRKNDGPQKIEYLTVNLEDVMIQKITWGGQGDAQTVSENLQIAFAEFTLLYKTQRDSGDATGDLHFGYNLQTQAQT